MGTLHATFASVGELKKVRSLQQKDSVGRSDFTTCSFKREYSCQFVHKKIGLILL